MSYKEFIAFLFELLNGPFALTDLVRAVLLTVIFAYASYEDIQDRRVHDELWVPVLLGGTLLLIYDFLTGNLTYLAQVTAANFLFAAIVGVVLFRFRVFYGADMKALIAIGLAMPTYPLLGQYPLIMPPTLDPPLHMTQLFALTVMSNTALVSVLYPLRTLYHNYRTGKFGSAHPLWLLAARRVPISDLNGRHGHIIETYAMDEEDLSSNPLVRGWQLFTAALNGLNVEFVDDYLDWRNQNTDEPLDHLGELDGRTHLEAFVEAQDEGGWETADIEQDKDDLRQLAAQDEVWMTPGIPFLVPMTIGLILSFIVGDLVYAAVLFLN